MCNVLINSHACAALVSEEVEETIIVPPEKRGKVHREQNARKRYHARADVVRRAARKHKSLSESRHTTVGGRGG